MHPDHGNSRLAAAAESMLVLASAVRPRHAVLRCPTIVRPCIIGRDDFFVRYGEKEREAVASFDFLDDFSTGSLTTSSIEEECAELVLPAGDSEKLV